MTNKKNLKNNRESLDNNVEMKKLLKENENKMEIAEEIKSSKKLSEVLAGRLANKKRFPPC